jgi:hypothetical protein
MMKRKAMLRVCALYSLLVWLYVVGLEYVNIQSVPTHLSWFIYADFAVWIPVRTDYAGEAAFVVSFILSLLSCLHEENVRPSRG